MPRTGWLAVGAAIAALAVGAEDRHLVGALVAASGLLLLVGLWLPRGRRIGLLALAIGILSIALRAGVGPAGAALSGSPTGGGPWTMVVETVGSPREGHQVATIRTVIRRRDRIPGRRNAAALSSDRTWRPNHRGGTCAAETGQLVWSIPRATRRVGHPRRPIDGGAAAAHRSRHIAGRMAPRCRRAADPRAPRTRGGTRRGDPDRPARSRRPGGRGRLHDRRRQPRRRHLGLEHRHRGGRRRGDGRSARASTTSDRHRHRGRHVHRVRRGLAIGAPCGGDGRSGPPRPGVRSKRPGRRGARSRGVPAAPRGARPRERRRLPAVDARHRRSRGLGDAADGASGPPDPWTTAPLVERKPRRLPGSAGGDTPRRARLVRAAGADLAGR